jgi:hypothetical protein
MTMPTFLDGVLVHAVSLTSLSSGVNSLNSLLTGAVAPRAYVPTSTAHINALQSIANNTNTVVTWGSAGLNNDAMWASGSPTLFTVKTAGVYIAWAQAHFSAAAGGVRACYILLNGTNIATNTVASAFRNPLNAGDGNFFCCVTPPMQLAVNATLAVAVYQNTGGSLSLDNTDSGAFMGVTRIGS